MIAIQKKKIKGVVEKEILQKLEQLRRKVKRNTETDSLLENSGKEEKEVSIDSESCDNVANARLLSTRKRSSKNVEEIERNPFKGKDMPESWRTVDRKKRDPKVRVSEYDSAGRREKVEEEEIQIKKVSSRVRTFLSEI